MLGVTRFEVHNSLLKIPIENFNFVQSKPFERRGYSSEEIKNDGEIFKPEDLKDQLLRLVVIDE